MFISVQAVFVCLQQQQQREKKPRFWSVVSILCFTDDPCDRLATTATFSPAPYGPVRTAPLVLTLNRCPLKHVCYWNHESKNHFSLTAVFDISVIRTSWCLHQCGGGGGGRARGVVPRSQLFPPSELSSHFSLSLWKANARLADVLISAWSRKPSVSTADESLQRRASAVV